MTPAYDLLSNSVHLPYESRTALELFEEYDTESFEANGFYAYDDFLAFGERLEISTKMIETLFAKQLSTRGGEVLCRVIDNKVKISGRAVKCLEGWIEIEIE